MKNLPTLLLEAERAFDEILPPPKSEDEYVSEHMAIRSLTEDTLLTATEFQMVVNSHQLLVRKHSQLKSFLQETVLSILSEAEKATEVEGLANTKGEANSDWFYGFGFNSALSQVKSLWREWRG